MNNECLEKDLGEPRAHGDICVVKIVNKTLKEWDISISGDCVFYMEGSPSSCTAPGLGGDVPAGQVLPFECSVGGDVKNVIVHLYAKKGHDGAKHEYIVTYDDPHGGPMPDQTWEFRRKEDFPQWTDLDLVRVDTGT